MLGFVWGSYVTKFHRFVDEIFVHKIIFERKGDFLEIPLSLVARHRVALLLNHAENQQYF